MSLPDEVMRAAGDFRIIRQISEIPGEPHDVASYHAMRQQETRRLTQPIWKLERSQYFLEPDDDPSWQAYLRRDWNLVRAIFEGERSSARAEAQQYKEQGVALRRLRIVQRPISDYLLWEMQWFEILAQEGIEIRTLQADRVSALENERPLPEILVDEHAFYHVQYDDSWKACGARRIGDPNIIRMATREIAALWELAEPFSHYFSREIAPRVSYRSARHVAADDYPERLTDPSVVTDSPPSPSPPKTPPRPARRDRPHR